MSSSLVLPTVSRDPRFRAGRTLVERGQCEQAIGVFATLLEEARRTYGDDHLETAPAYYEYGNAIFRASQHVEEGEEDENTIIIKTETEKREAAAAAAERRVNPPSNDATTAKEDPTEDAKPASVPTNKSTGKATNPETVVSHKGVEQVNDGDDDDAEVTADNEEDVKLALEMMETAWSILDRYVEEEDKRSTERINYTDWAKEQVPRFLTGIGDILSALERHADAADAYCRALGHRQKDLEEFTTASSSSDKSMEFLKCRRRVVEANVLIAEELLACPAGQDVVTSESGDMLVSAAERVDYARGYYDKARDELQETVLLMGEMAAAGKDVKEEKENVCFVATMVMGVGTTLAGIDEQAAEEQDDSAEPIKKKAKKG